MGTTPLLLQNNLKWVLDSAKPTVNDQYAFRPSERKTHSQNSKGGAREAMIERTTTLAPAITRTRKLSIEQLKDLKLPLIFQQDIIIIERSLNGWKLRTPISINLEKVLEAQEIGLVEYIIKSCLSYQPSIIPYIFENKSLVKVARHFFRHRSGSHASCLMYAVKLRKYAICGARTQP